MAKQSDASKIKKLRARIKELESQQELAKKIVSNVKVRDVTHGVGFVAMAWIIKEGAFDPLRQLLDSLGLLKAPSAEDAPIATVLAESGWGFPVLGKIEQFGNKLYSLPPEIAQKGIDDFIKQVKDLGVKMDEQGVEKDDPTANAAMESILNIELAKAEFAGWMWGFAGAWAFGKFLSETTWSEVVEAIPVIQ